MTGKRKRYSAEFKAKVALEALRGELTTAQLATKHGVHQTIISEWKRQAVDGLASIFSGKAEEGHGVGRKRVRRLMAKMGLAPIYQKPRTTVPHPEHRIYQRFHRQSAP